MKQINLKDDPGECDLAGVELVVTQYDAGEYDGSGYAAFVKDDGTCWYMDLGHCSCYGPWDESVWGDDRGAIPFNPWSDNATDDPIPHGLWECFLKELSELIERDASYTHE